MRRSWQHGLRRQLGPWASTFLLVVLLGIAPRPASSDEVIYVPSDPALDWALREFDTPWSSSAIFKAMTALVMEQSVPMANLCDPTFRSDAAARLGFSALSWRTVDYRQHLDVVEAHYIDYARTTIPIGSDNETWARLERQFWDDFSAGILDVFARGDAVMEATDVDVDKDGAIETLFRLPLLDPLTLVEGSNRRPEIGTAWGVRNCSGGPPDTPIYHAMLSPDSAAALGAYGERLETALERMSVLLLFRFEGRVHGINSSGRGGGVMDITRKGDLASVTNNLWTGYITLRSTLEDNEPVIKWRPQ